MLRRRFKKKLQYFGHMSKMGLIYLPNTLVWTNISLDKYSQFSCLPYLPFWKVWIFWKESLLLNSYLHGIYWGTMKMPIIWEAFKLRLSLIMTLNNENPFQTTAKTFSSSPYLEFTILLYKYGLPYLPTYHKNLWNYGWRIPYLHTVWTYV